jgi:hypothetical protein
VAPSHAPYDSMFQMTDAQIHEAISKLKKQEKKAKKSDSRIDPDFHVIDSVISKLQQELDRRAQIKNDLIQTM